MPSNTTAKKDTGAKEQAKVSVTVIDALQSSIPSFNKLGDHAKLNLQAGVASANAAASGARAVGSQAFAASKALLEVQMITAKQVAGVRTLQDLFNLQGAYTKSLLETYSAQTAKGSETLKAAVSEAWAPLGERVEVALKSLQGVEG